MSELSWTLYDSQPDLEAIGSGSGMPPPQVQSRTEQYNPEQLASIINGGNAGKGSGSAGVSKNTEEKVVSSGEDESRNISNYNSNWDLVYIFIAVLAIDVFVIFLARFYPEIFGRNLNRWYDLFGLNAVIADVLIIFIGFIIARYVYTWWISKKVGGWNSLAFTGTVVATQLVHDILFYLGVIKPIPRGHNLMIDLFKDYSEGAGAKILVGDAAMMIGSSFLAMNLKTLPGHAVAAFASVVTYALPYILYTRNMFTVLR